jgi:hypothetical protein
VYCPGGSASNLNSPFASDLVVLEKLVVASVATMVVFGTMAPELSRTVPEIAPVTSARRFSALQLNRKSTTASFGRDKTPPPDTDLNQMLLAGAYRN